MVLPLENGLISTYVLDLVKPNRVKTFPRHGAFNGALRVPFSLATSPLDDQPCILSSWLLVPLIIHQFRRLDKPSPSANGRWSVLECCSDGRISLPGQQITPRKICAVISMEYMVYRIDANGRKFKRDASWQFRHPLS